MNICKTKKINIFQFYRWWICIYSLFSFFFCFGNPIYIAQLNSKQQQQLKQWISITNYIFVVYFQKSFSKKPKISRLNVYRICSYVLYLCVRSCNQNNCIRYCIAHYNVLTLWQALNFHLCKLIPLDVTVVLNDCCFSTSSFFFFYVNSSTGNR